MKVRELQEYLLRHDAEDDVVIYLGDVGDVRDEDYKIDSISHNGTDSVVILVGDSVG